MAGITYEEATAPAPRGLTYDEATQQPEQPDTSPSFMTGLMDRVKEGFTQDPNSTRNQMRAGVEAQLRTSLSNYPGDVKDVFMEGVHQAKDAFLGNGKSQFDDLRDNVENQLIAVGRTPEQAKGETDRLMEGWKRQERMVGAIFGPLTAITAPFFGGPMRSFISRPIEEQTEFPKEATEGFINVGAAALGMRSLARVTIGKDGKVSAHAIGDAPKPEDFKTAAEILTKPDQGNETVKSAAIRLKDGSVHTGITHADALEAAMKENPNAAEMIWPIDPEAKGIAGDFITSKGRLVSRYEAQRIADPVGDDVIGLTGEKLKAIQENTEANLRTLWEERGIHPAEALNDAKNDTWARNELTQPPETAEPRPGGADVPHDPPLVSPTIEPSPPTGSMATAIQDAGNKLLEIDRDIKMMVAPMVSGSTKESMALVKDFANGMRRNRWELDREVKDITDRFKPEQYKRMWDAADEESVARQLGESTEHQGLVTLEPTERLTVEIQHEKLQNSWLRAIDVGIVKGEGLPAYTPRMAANVANAIAEDGALALNSIGNNLKTSSPNLRHRKYMTAEETEAAMKEKYGAQARIARDIRTLPLARKKIEDAIAGRTLVNKIKEAGKAAGEETVAEGAIPTDSEHKWFTIDHPALKTWKPRLEEAADGSVKAVKDAEGNTIFDQVPIYIRADFEGPLRSVLSGKNGPLYQGAMALKGKTMSVIMYSPAIHNLVELGRAFPSMPTRIFKAYFDGNRAKNDPAIMREAIDNGLVPIGKRFFNQDIDSIMEGPDLTPGRSWTSKVLAFVPGLFDEAAGTAVKRAIDKAGDIYHNTLLWDRIADLQMGIYTNLRGDMLKKGVDPQTASRMAAHMANRYAGALPQEAMSQAATKTANMLLFSRTFTMGNLGVLKDMFTGMPKDVLAQIERDAGVVDPKAVGYAKSLAKRKAIATVALDIGLMYVGNSVLQSAFNVMLGDKTIDEETHGYTRRLKETINKVEMHPLSLLQPFDLVEGLTSNSENEPGKKDRIKIGTAADGTAIYARNPIGKIGEEFIGYMSPLDVLRRKEGTIARPMMQVFANDKGFGRKVYDPNAETPFEKAGVIWAVIKHIAKAQTPEGSINAFSDLLRGEGDPKVNALQTIGPLGGVTFSRGAPGGPPVGELYSARGRHQFSVDLALPDIRRQILRGDMQGATDRMNELGIPPGLQRFYIRTSLNPSTRLSGKALADFYRYADPKQIERMERAQGVE